MVSLIHSPTHPLTHSLTPPSDPLARLALWCPLRMFLALCSAPVTSRLVTFYACSGLLVQRSWLYSGFDSCFQGFAQCSLCEEARALRELQFWRYWLRERGVFRHSNRLRPSGGPRRERVAAAARLYLQQQAAACMASPGFTYVRHRRQDEWTSTPRVSRGASA